MPTDVYFPPYNHPHYSHPYTEKLTTLRSQVLLPSKHISDSVPNSKLYVYVGFPKPPSKSPTPAGCPVVPLNSDTTLKACQIPQLEGSVLQDPPPFPLQTPT